jgi:hypothetical protein
LSLAGSLANSMQQRQFALTRFGMMLFRRHILRIWQDRGQSGDAGCSQGGKAWRSRESGDRIGRFIL